MGNIIEVKNLHYEYPGDEETPPVKVLHDICIDIKRGEFVAVLGRNGSGKSTFAKHLNGILQPTSGTILIDGLDTADEKNITEIRKRAGMVFQNPDNQMVANIIEEDVAFAPENLGIERSEIRKRVDEALAAVNMSAFAKHAPHMLSGGQKQRIAIAGVLAMEPDIIILDEATAMLDPNGRREVIETVKRLNREKNMTIVLITHYMEETVGADRIIVMDKGKVALSDTPSKVFKDAELTKRLGLDVPYAAELLAALKKRGFDLDTNVLTDDECVDRIMDLYRKKVKCL